MALTLPRLSYWRRSSLSAQSRSPIPPVQPKWLLGLFTSHEWTVTGIGHQAPTTINFDVYLSDGRPLSLANPHLLETVKWLTYWLRTGPMPSFESGVAQATAARNLITLAAWMVRNGIERFDELTTLDLEVYASSAAQGRAALLEVDEQLERYLAQLRREATAAVDRGDAPNYTSAILALLPTTRRGRGQPILNHARLLDHAGLKGLTRHSNVLSILRAFADEEEIQTDIKNGTEDETRVPVCTEHLRRFLMSFQYLYQYQTLLDDGLHFNPFAEATAGKVAERLGAQIGRTATVPPLQAMTLIERCIRWVLDYSEPLLTLQRIGNENPSELPEALAKFKLSGLGAPRLKSTRDAEDAGPVFDSCGSSALLTLDQALRLLATTCATTMAAGSARRSFEVSSSRVGCIRRDSTGGYWLTTFIHKSLRRDASIPVPAVVARAVEVLERLSEVARQLTGTPYLLQVNKTGTEECHWTTVGGHPAFPFAFYLDKLGLYLDVPPTEDGTRWHFNPHQTRRFFAIVYIWIYEVGEFGALSDHLKHFDISHTMRYVTEEEVAKIVRVVRRERTAMILAKAAAGYGTARTEHAGRLREMAVRTRDRLMLRMHVLPARKYIQRLERMIDLAGVTLSAAEFGFDAFTPEDVSLMGTSAIQRLPVGHLAGTDAFHQCVASSINAGATVRNASAAWAH